LWPCRLRLEADGDRWNAPVQRARLRDPLETLDICLSGTLYRFDKLPQGNTHCSRSGFQLLDCEYSFGAQELCIFRNHLDELVRNLSASMNVHMALLKHSSEYQQVVRRKSCEDINAGVSLEVFSSIEQDLEITLFSADALGLAITEYLEC
jgi:hypothetical protein